MKCDLLINNINEIAPGFAEYAESANNAFEIGAVHGIFAAFSHFVCKENCHHDWKNIGTYINSVVDGSNSDLDNAACTCFIENIARSGHPIEVHLSGCANKYWHDCI